MQALAIQISENALAHRICGQRNPRSVAGASIYLASHLEDQGTTQTEISKVRLPLSDPMMMHACDKRVEAAAKVVACQRDLMGQRQLQSLTHHIS